MGDMISEAARVRFVEHELRARRFLLLPRLLFSRDDTAKFAAQASKVIKDARQQRNAGKAKPALTGDAGISCPSYLPPAHPQTEAHFVYCPETCLGRRGDEEILAMVRTARSQPDGWTVIEKRSMNSGTSGHRGKGSSSERVSPFGDSVAAEELDRWG